MACHITSTKKMFLQLSHGRLATLMPIPQVDCSTVSHLRQTLLKRTFKSVHDCARKQQETSLQGSTHLLAMGKLVPPNDFALPFLFTSHWSHVILSAQSHCFTGTEQDKLVALVIQGHGYPELAAAINQALARTCTGRPKCSASYGCTSILATAQQRSSCCTRQ